MIETHGTAPIELNWHGIGVQVSLIGRQSLADALRITTRRRMRYDRGIRRETARGKDFPMRLLIGGNLLTFICIAVGLVVGWFVVVA